MAYIARTPIVIHFASTFFSIPAASPIRTVTVTPGKMGPISPRPSTPYLPSIRRQRFRICALFLASNRARITLVDDPIVSSISSRLS